MTGWLVNDCLTTIPETQTFWHNLLDWIEELQDKTNGYTDYSRLAQYIEEEYRQIQKKPKYVIRNGTFFRIIQIPIPQISLIQDNYINTPHLFQLQCQVINHSKIVVFNSEFIYNIYKDFVKVPHRIIPLGVDSDFFKPIKERMCEVLPKSILFIGAATNFPKGFDRLQEIIEKMKNRNFCLIMKDNFQVSNELKHRVKVFNRVSADTVRKIINSCSVAVCTSVMETQHLSGIECCLCNVPVVSFSVGIYDKLKNQTGWGYTVLRVEEAIDKLEYILENPGNLNPRQVMIDNKFDLNSCKKSWQDLIHSLL